MKKIGKILEVLLQILIVIWVIILTALLFSTNKFGYMEWGKNTLVPINETNEELLDDYKNGDLLVIEKLRFTDVKVGDEIYHYDTVDNTPIIRKAIIKEKAGDKISPLYILENSRSITKDKLIGKAKEGKNSGLGTFLDVVSSRFGFLFAAILPIFVIFIYQVYKMILLIKSDDFDEDDNDEEEKETSLKEEKKEIAKEEENSNNSETEKKEETKK